MVKDKRYKVIKHLIEGGHIKSLSEIFDTIPKSVAARDFGTNYSRFTKLIENPANFRLKEIYTLARLFDIDERKMIDLAHTQHTSKGKRKKP
jgi:hypothetical protein